MKFVFDFAGVLFRWHPPTLLRRELPQHAHDEASAQFWVDQIFQNYAGDWGEFDRGTVGVAELVQRIAKRTGLSLAQTRHVVDRVPEELQPIPETVAWVRRLNAAGCPLYYLSNMPAPYARVLEQRNDFLHCFDDGVFSSRVHQIKPEPAIFELAARQFGATPAELVFFDDMPANVAAACAMGWNALHFVDAAQAERELQAQGWLSARRLAAERT